MRPRDKIKRLLRIIKKLISNNKKIYYKYDKHYLKTVAKLILNRVNVNFTDLLNFFLYLFQYVYFQKFKLLIQAIFLRFLTI